MCVFLVEVYEFYQNKRNWSNKYKLVKIKTYGLYATLKGLFTSPFSLVEKKLSMYIISSSIFNHNVTD